MAAYLRKRHLVAVLLLSALCAGLPSPLAAQDAAGAAPPASQTPEQSYRQLRKEFLISSSLPRADKGVREEHLQFYRRCSRVIETLAADDAAQRPYLIASLGIRGMLLLHCGQFARARQDFDAALALFPQPAEDGDKTPADPALPPGAASRDLLKVYRAFTFIEDGVEKFVAEMSALPDTDLAGGQDVLRRQIAALAESLAARERYDEAIAVYGIIGKYALWDTDKDQDPQRVMEILETQKKNRGGMQ